MHLSVNTFAYTSLNPLKFTDTLGLFEAPSPRVEVAPVVGEGIWARILAFVARAGGTVTMMLWPSELGDDNLLTPEVQKRLDDFLDTDIDEMCSERDGKDPCAGLRRTLRDHLKKLRDYLQNPFDPKNDNKGILANSPASRYRDIISGRIWNLLNQIENFKRLLRECELQNGIR